MVFLRVVRRIVIVKIRRRHIRMLCETLLVCIGARSGTWWARIEVAARCVRWRRRSIRDGVLIT